MTKKMEVAQFYLLGHPYGEIEEKTGVSHGSIVNIIKELETGKLVIPGLPSDQVNDLRQLSLDLNKKGLTPPQALLGIILFDRLNKLGITSADLDHWSHLVKVFAPANFPAKDFFEAALKLRHLEETAGKPFENLVEEYLSLTEKVDVLSEKTDLLDKDKTELDHEINSLAAQVNVLEKKNDQLKSSVEIQSAKLQDIKTALAEAVAERAQLRKEVKELKKLKVKFSSEVDGKVESLTRLEYIGFSDEDLIRLRNIIEEMSKKEGDGTNFKEKFFYALGHFTDLNELKKAVQAEAKMTNELMNQKSSLVGEIAELEKRKALLQGEIYEGASTAAQQIRAASEEAVSLIRGEATAIGKEVRCIMEDTLVAGVAVGEMLAVQRKSDESGNELEGLLNEVKGGLGRR
jgi:predicted  nucleic acid-binding Zn-ribbon protein